MSSELSKKVYNNKYQTLFQVRVLDENGDPVVNVKMTMDDSTGTTSTRNRGEWVDAEEVDDIPDWFHQQVTREVLDYLTVEGCVNFADLEAKFGPAFKSVRLDYIRRWVENWTARQQPPEPYELVPVTSRFWSGGKAAQPEDVTVADSYIVKGKRTTAGWVSTLADNGEMIVRASLRFRGNIIKGSIDKLASEASKNPHTMGDAQKAGRLMRKTGKLLPQ